MASRTGAIEDRSALGQLNDPNVKITPGDIYYSNVEELGLEKEWKDKSVLSIGDVKELWKAVKDNQSQKKTYLHELLAGSQLIIPGLEVPKRNPELEKRLAVLRNQLDEKEYQRMTSNINAASPYKSSPDDSISYQLKQMNSTIIAVIQFVITLAAAFLFGFSGVEVFVGPLDLAVRLLLGIGSAVLIGVAELYVLVVLLDSREQEEEKEKKVK